MSLINEMIVKKMSLGMNRREAENYCCQEIVLNKISKSSFNDKVLIKGGVVMFNYTHNIRRTTNDLDFDFFRYSISDDSIIIFIDELNKYDGECKVEINSIEELHQDDYHGKRLFAFITDGVSTLKFKMDIGVHTLTAIEQNNIIFDFYDDKGTLTLRANPFEQIFAEKIYSLAKHGVLSQRYKDIYDIYYLIKNAKLNRDTIAQCLDLLTIRSRYGLSSLIDVRNRVIEVLSDRYFVNRLSMTKHKWIDVNDDIAIKEIIDYLQLL